MIILFTGQPGSGKTTLAKTLVQHIELGNLINIDGDDLRAVMNNKNYSKEGRVQNINTAFTMAKFLEHKGFVPILSIVSPYRELREGLKKDCDVKEIYVHTTEIRGREDYFAKDYKKPLENFLDIDTTDISTTKCMTKIVEFITK